MNIVIGMSEIDTPVPLEEVKGFFFKTPDGGGEPVKTDVGWKDLSELEQKLTTLILEGKYGDAYDLSGNGKSQTYDKTILKGFLDAVVDQHNKNFGRAFLNESVRSVLGN